ncbi:class D beta-lactamase [Pseudovibrio sp. Tun.PSC04-5.I4]|uniref:class D beta-lactamase n=1 Tax=Pseudovibrio sp. Tun.PSC04-5.I4 TaxID=1798213 RepID=UPI00088A73CB|nr:class D beta-lactamase [Pseudovibrio sp. Tun.PSC04-5.I4]SDR24356.1 beta-lactamase class D [Pseudovibrio sp. Tun.PSC04-5.I4]
MKTPNTFLLALSAIGFLISTSTSSSMEIVEREDLNEVFLQSGSEGTFVLYDIAKDRMVLVNRSRAAARKIPASTFKIPNSLIALELGIVAGVDEVVPTGNRKLALESWRKPMGLREAIMVSNVPVYQEIAQRVGPKAYTEWLAKLQYGNATIGENVERFWLNGPLEISAKEQAVFLSKLATRDLPFSERTLDDVHEITLLEDTSGYELHAKTGWSISTKPGIGWWVGWVEQNDSVYTFALNMDIHSRSDLPKRIDLARNFLMRLGLLDPQ